MATAIEERLEDIWGEAPGLASWLTTVDHKRIGLRYLYTGLIFFVAGGIEALLMRTQLARPNGEFLNPETYNQLFSTHGITMMFLFATPVLSGFGNYFVLLMIGARDMAFPRLNAFGYWVFLASGIFMYSAFLIGQAPNDGWFNYLPLADQRFSPGLNIDFFALGLIFLSRRAVPSTSSSASSSCGRRVCRSTASPSSYGESWPCRCRSSSRFRS